jgi:acyl-CoA synthetase (AMP-forming)/AMP-acid ligase II
MCAGYWEDEQATEDLFDEGWLRTGDLGFLDAGGYLHVTGRSKELIISGGMNVFPAEVEAVLESHPKVRSAAVFGLPDERWGETVVAAVERSVEASEEVVTAEDLIEHCRAHLSGHKKPTRLWFVDALPRTPSGKIRRQELIARFSQAGGDDV